MSNWGKQVPDAHKACQTHIALSKTTSATWAPVAYLQGIQRFPGLAVGEGNAHQHQESWEWVREVSPILWRGEGKERPEGCKLEDRLCPTDTVGEHAIE